MHARATKTETKPVAIGIGRGKRGAPGAGCALGKAGTPATTLAMSRPGDLYEREADRVAQAVTSMPDPPSHRPCSCGGTCPRCRASADRSMLQTKEQPGSASAQSAAPAALPGGKQLAAADLAFFEPRFGADFSHVRLHDGAQADAAARAVGALAYTVGSDVVLRAGQRIDSVSGRRLLAHELTHVVQQSGGMSQGANPLGISAGTTPMLSRYSHQDCLESDLRDHVWPADHIARGMVDRAIAALSGTLTPHVTSLMNLNFNDASPSTVAAVLEKLRTIKAEYDGNDYQYECEDDCDDANAYVYGIWSDVHLCMNKLRGRSNNFIAGVMVHEMSHYAAGTDDNEYFYPGTAPEQTTLGTSDAIDNGDSYEGFVARL